MKASVGSNRCPSMESPRLFYLLAQRNYKSLLSTIVGIDSDSSDKTQGVGCCLSTKDVGPDFGAIMQPSHFITSWIPYVNSWSLIWPNKLCQYSMSHPPASRMTPMPNQDPDPIYGSEINIPDKHAEYETKEIGCGEGSREYFRVWAPEGAGPTCGETLVSRGWVDLRRRQLLLRGSARATPRFARSVR